MKWHEKLLEYINWCYICMKHGECYYKEGEFEEGILFGRIKQKELWEKGE